MRRQRPLHGTQVTHFPEGDHCTITGPRATMEDVKKCARVCGSHFFDPETMRFFKSRVGADAYFDGHLGAYFITSEQNRGPRVYATRHFNECTITTIDKGFRTKQQALSTLKPLLKARIQTKQETLFGGARRRRGSRRRHPR